jgi:predicted dehydrogenase/threonine dehydrogenase-like Zn-dependent dehydrogenase
MKQVYQNFKGGGIKVEDTPAPKLMSGQILIHTQASLLSAGTEGMVTEFSNKSLFQKAKSRPDLVKQVIDKAKTDGVISAYNTVKNRLDQPIALGYSAAGIILEVAEDVEGFKIGDRVACAGAGYASHANILAVPKNLVIKIPNNVPFDSAAFTTVGAIALQGVRLAQTELSENVAVIGLGLIGQITAQLLKAAGCKVVGYDLDFNKVDLARSCGIDFATNELNLFKDYCNNMSNNFGVDKILITASTKSNDPIELSGVIARDKAIIVAVGAVGLDIPRKTYYHKELEFRISRSYGPGRYDPNYEERGHDYPIGFVRWTENRNMQSFINLVSEGKIDPKKFISHSFPIEEAEKAYDLIKVDSIEDYLGIILNYPGEPELSKTIKFPNLSNSRTNNQGEISIGVIGAGGFAAGVLIPILKSHNKVKLKGLCTVKGYTSHFNGSKFGFEYCTTDSDHLINDSSIDTIFICSRHDSHAELVLKSLKASKNVFVEKPLAINNTELEEIRKFIVGGKSAFLMVGFNRRFSPHISEIKSRLGSEKSPKSVIVTINPGQILKDHWTQDKLIGGGRIIGEGCHFIDLVRYIVDSPIKSWSAQKMGKDNLNDKVTINLSFEDGSIGTVHYFSNGNKQFPKERIEVFSSGMIFQIDNFLKINNYGAPRPKKMQLNKQDKGHEKEINQFVSSIIENQTSPIPFDELYEVSKISIDIANSI